jgi:hypothetical protein
MIAQLDLPGFDQGPKQRGVFGPRAIGARDEIREPHTGVLGELCLKPDHIGVGTVIDRPCQ